MKFSINCMKCLIHDHSTGFINNKPSININKYRFVHTTSTSNSNNYSLPHWPTSLSPTPYEIFGTTPETFDIKKIKKVYHQLVRIYHPDSSISLHNNNYNLNDKISKSHLNLHSTNITNTNTTKLKLDRFKKITSAYEILRDDQKRRLYDRYKTGWEYSGSPTSRSRNTNTNRYTKSPYMNDPEYWNAGTWQDFQRMKDRKDGKTKDYKWPILGVLLFLSISFSYIQLMHMIESGAFGARGSGGHGKRYGNTQYQESLRAIQREQDNLKYSRDVGDDVDDELIAKQERIQRFLERREQEFKLKDELRRLQHGNLNNNVNNNINNDDKFTGNTLLITDGKDKSN